jgi:hypothetical protein
MAPWIAACGAACLLIATVTACGDDDTTGGGGAGAATTSTTTNTFTLTGSTTTTGSGGQGGTVDTQQLCDDAAAKVLDCGAGTGGAGGMGPVACGEVEICQAYCTLDATCNDITLQTPNYSGCLDCCFNPAGC